MGAMATCIRDLAMHPGCSSTKVDWPALKLLELPSKQVMIPLCRSQLVKMYRPWDIMNKAFPGDLTTILHAALMPCMLWW
jgi:hypothetical protein